MLRLPKIVTGAVAGAALLMFGVISAYPQAAPRGVTPPSAETTVTMAATIIVMTWLRG